MGSWRGVRATQRAAIYRTEFEGGQLSGMAEREGFELGGGTHEINNLLISLQLLSPAIPSNPRIWQ